MNLEDLNPLESAMKRITGFFPGASLASYASPISYDASTQPAAMSATPGAAQPVTTEAPVAATPAASVAAVPAASAGGGFDAVAVRSAMTAAGVPGSHINAVMAGQGIAPQRNPAEPSKITRSELSRRQIEGQQKNYMQNWNNQLAFLRSTGAYKPSQLNFKQPVWDTKPVAWGKYSNDLVSNPYA